MNRRDFLRTGAGAGSAAAIGLPADAVANRHYYELRIYELRNDIEPGRIQAYFEESFVPAAQRAGAGPIGVFTPEAGLRSPSLVVLVPYPSLGDLHQIRERLEADPAHRRGQEELARLDRVPFVRYSASLYHAFSGHPAVETATPAEGQPSRLFELRTYESRSPLSLAAKIDMFDREEIQIFRNVGINPVFFGEAVFADRLPQLTYMVAYADMEARAAAWNAFRVDPDWVRIRDTPGWTNPEAVSAIESAFLRPTRYSQIQ